MELLRRVYNPQVFKCCILKGIIFGQFTNALATEFIAAYNLLIHLIRQSSNMDMFLPKICQHLSNPITTAPIHGPGLALSILTTIFNILNTTSETRYRVFQSMLKVIRVNGLFETLQSQLKNLDVWLQEWETDEEDSRILFVEIANIAEDAGELEFTPPTSLALILG
jgi:translation initiation factor 3 subunit M